MDAGALKKTATELAAEAGMSYGDYLKSNGPQLTVDTGRLERKESDRRLADFIEADSRKSNPDVELEVR